LAFDFIPVLDNNKKRTLFAFNKAHWVGPGQEHILKMLTKLELNTYPQHEEGVKISDHNNKVLTFTGDIPPASIFGLLDLHFRALKPLERLKNDALVEDPISSAKLYEYDGKTLESWKRENFFTQEAMDIFDLAIRSIVGVEPSEISFFYTLLYANSSKGLQYLTQVKNGAQQDQIEGGTQQISIQLASKLKNQIELNTPVTKIVQNELGVTVESTILGKETRVFKAKYAILALPPNLQTKIEFSPELSEDRIQACRRMFGCAYIKVYCQYTSAFWRSKGFSGEVLAFGNEAQISFVFDCCSYDSKYFSLAVFIAGRNARTFQKKTEQERKEIVLNNLVKYYGEEASNPINYLEQDWSKEEYIQGALNLFPPGVISQYGYEIRKPINRIYFAGSLFVFLLFFFSYLFPVLLILCSFFSCLFPVFFFLSK